MCSPIDTMLELTDNILKARDIQAITYKVNNCIVIRGARWHPYHYNERKVVYWPWILKCEGEKIEVIWE